MVYCKANVIAVQSRLSSPLLNNENELNHAAKFAFWVLQVHRHLVKKSNSGFSNQHHKNDYTKNFVSTYIETPFLWTAAFNEKKKKKTYMYGIHGG